MHVIILSEAAWSFVLYLFMFYICFPAFYSLFEFDYCNYLWYHLRFSFNARIFLWTPIGSPPSFVEHASLVDSLFLLFDPFVSSYIVDMIYRVKLITSFLHRFLKIFFAYIARLNDNQDSNNLCKIAIECWWKDGERNTIFFDLRWTMTVSVYMFKPTRKHCLIEKKTPIKIILHSKSFTV